MHSFLKTLHSVETSKRKKIVKSVGGCNGGFRVTKRYPEQCAARAGESFWKDNYGPQYDRSYGSAPWMRYDSGVHYIAHARAVLYSEMYISTVVCVHTGATLCYWHTTPAPTTIRTVPTVTLTMLVVLCLAPWRNRAVHRAVHSDPSTYVTTFITTPPTQPHPPPPSRIPVGG